VAFALGAIAAFAGGTEHGLRPWLDQDTRARLRQCAFLGSAAAGLLLVAGVAWVATGGHRRRLLLAGLGGLLVAELALVAGTSAAREAAIAGAINVALLLGLALHQARGRDARLLARLAGGLALAAAGLAVQVAGIAPHAHFNHDDLCHVLLTAALWPFYRAGAALES
jgi:hypothetical protein